MITDLIREDHLAARDILAQIGNAAQQAHTERADGFRRFGRLWAIHGAMMAAAAPHLGDGQQEAPGLQQEVEALAADLAAREGEAGARDPRGDTPEPALRGDYERLRSIFERQVMLEQGELIPRLLDLPADSIAAATAAARTSRAG